MIKFDNKELKRRVDEVLYYVWDPIGVADSPYARREYSGYVGGILRLVEDNDEIEPISSHLFKVVEDQMGITPDKKHCDYTAELLLAHKKAIIEGCA